MDEAERRAHWQGTYQRNAPDTVSWFQSEPAVSLALIERCGLDADEPVIDIGGGASMLVDRLHARGFRALSVLDVARAALDTSRSRLGDAAASVQWIEQDLLGWQPQQAYALWHDRAVFHFLVDPDDRLRYVDTARRAVRPGGWLIVSTFALTGPERCSGLPVQRHDAASLVAAFSPAFDLVESVAESHQTPAGRTQDFVYVRLRRSD